ncbi:hypothetical protein [Mesorhizobium sp. WSM3873]|uniref:hypothetical protein n=1 Tax=Mesorhizobium sp. WSM3873 TaxID=1854056 RepID=UPI00082BB623|nr:hypothetical protein [Mesorhizobium sp. WSM3873]
MAMLETVLQKLLPASADAAEREWLGSLLIAAFQNGATDEAALIATMDRKANRKLASPCMQTFASLHHLIASHPAAFASSRDRCSS